MFGDNKPVRMLITAGECRDDDISAAILRLERLAVAAASREIDFFQIREKSLSGKSLYALTKRLATVTEAAPIKIIVNGRFDIALAAGAAGVHLPGDSLPADVVRRHVPAGFIVGVSTHSPDEIVAAKSAGADYALFGPVFATPGKGDPAGLHGLAKAVLCAENLPVIAVGGIDVRHADEVMRAGAAGFAAIRYFLNELRGETAEK